MTIFLIGFMGSGKSYLGNNLAQLMDFHFIDMDDWIEEQEGMTIKKIFETKKEAYFRELETSTIHELAKKDNHIIACGGGTPCYHNNIQLLNQLGLTIYLEATIDLLYDRLRNETDHRPLLKGKDENSLKQFIKEKLAVRNQFYKQANIIFQQDGEKVARAQDLLEKLRPHLK